MGAGSRLRIKMRAGPDLSICESIILNQKQFCMDTYVDELGIIYSADRKTIIKGSEGVEHLTIPDTVIKIGNCAFSCCNLVSVSLSNSLKSIEEEAFSFCFSLKSIVIPDSVKRIGKNAFSGCYNLVSVSLSNSLRSIEEETFQNCSHLTNIIIPNSVTEIKKGAFAGCFALSSIVLSNSLVDIGKYTFSGCNSLKSIKIPKTVTKINSCAFLSSGLESIKLPYSVNRISESAFEDSKSLKSVIISNRHVKIALFAFPPSCVIQVPKSFLDEFREKYGDYWTFVERGHEANKGSNMCREAKTDNPLCAKKKLWPFLNISDYNHLLDGLIESKNKAENAHPLLQEFYSINIDFLSKRISKTQFVRRFYIAESIYNERIEVVNKRTKHILDGWRLFLDLYGCNEDLVRSKDIIEAMHWLL